MSERFYRELRLTLPDRATWTLPWVLEERARTHGERVFLDVPDHGRALTFRELRDAAHAIGRALLATGSQPGERVLIMAPNSAEVVLAWFGASVAGMVEVPINTAYTGAFLEHQVRTTGPRIAVVDADFAERFTSGEVAAYATIERFYVLGEGAARERAIAHLNGAGRSAAPFAELEQGAEGVELPAVAPQDTGAIFFTSGTTGLSKGVTMSHAHLSFFAQELISLVRLTDADTHMTVGPLFHGNAQFLAIYPALIAGARSVLRERYSASRWIDQIRESGATVTNFIGVMMDWTYKQPERPDDGDNDLRCIYTVPTPTSILRDFADRFGVEAFVENYGMTEISMPILSPYGVPRPAGAAGLLVDEFFEAKIVDPVTDLEVPVGEVGEFTVRAKEPWIMLTDYWNMPDRTAEAMRNLWFHTGDGIRRDADGWYYFVDRLKDAIRRRGENISSYEVEQAVLVHERIADCAAVAAPAASEAGEDEVALFVVVDPAAPMTVEQVREWCERQLPAFARPAYVELLETLPQTPSGKVRKVLLRELAGEAAERAASGTTA
ncbi:AMP-binding protein [Conexibacter sp. CPCC 206217]|uniref:AMP-binding protein n=1 Tax=Conexibacter sp. CPCC 206217 TaxID=3064574 RepID=UPI00271AC651|nr:AMP-binding protein [Conexibacter sp. CPCC 206217]MDO8212575.1 AMP-binding protein [Conexibacter sp. CPCC 206217]